MHQKIISLPDETRVVVRDPQVLTSKVVAELLDIVQKVESQEQATNGSRAKHLVYRVPFAGVRYYSYE